jgi:hypothetical protein
VRTTITLDPDVQALIQTAMKERAISFEEALNSAARAGLTQGKPRSHGFVQKAFSLGGDQNFRWDKALAAAAAVEDEELGRKFSLRKYYRRCQPADLCRQSGLTGPPEGKGVAGSNHLRTGDGRPSLDCPSGISTADHESRALRKTAGHDRGV